LPSILVPARGTPCARWSDAVERITGRKVPRRYVARRAGDPPELVADARRAREVLGWQAKSSDLDTIIGTAWAWQVKRNAGAANE